MKTKCVYYTVQAEYLNIIHIKLTQHGCDNTVDTQLQLHKYSGLILNESA
jgi:hypothetical protein